MDLNRFCSKRRSGMWQMDEPFSLGSYTYATDGVLCIQVPRVEGVGENEGAPDPRPLFIKALSHSDINWQALPPFKLEKNTCCECQGSGKVKICPWCRGLTTCKRCENADGYIPVAATDKNGETCEGCDGVGEVPDPGRIIVDGVRLNAIYLNKLAMLPRVEISCYDETSPVIIRFEGGFGLLMPMRM